jgi:hypothetical protein
MVDGGVRPKKTFGQKIKDQQGDIDTLYGLNSLSNFVSGIPAGNPIGVSGTGTTSDTINYLPTDGGTMIGPIAFFPILAAISNGEVDISFHVNNTGSLIVSSETGSTDDLLTITGARAVGQWLLIQGTATHTITLKNAINASATAWATSTVYALEDEVKNGVTDQVYHCKQAHTSSASDEPGVGANWTDFWFQANIETIDGNNFTLADDDNILFKFDSTDNNWQQITIGKQGIVSDTTYPHTPPINDHGNVGTVTEDIDLSLTTAHMHKITLTGNPTLTFSNPPASGNQIEFEIEYVQDSTGGRTVTQPGSVIETVIISTAASSVTIVTYRTNDGGTSYHAIPALRGSITLSGAGGGANTALSNLAATAVNTAINMRAQALTFDADDDTKIQAGTDDVLQFSTGASVRMSLSNTSLALTVPMSTNLDMDGNDIILDVDGDTKIDMSSDDIVRIDIGPTPTGSGTMLLQGEGEILWGHTGFTHTLTPSATGIEFDLGANTDNFTIKFSDAAKDMIFTDNHLDTSSDAIGWFFESIYSPSVPADNDVVALYQWNMKNSIGTVEPHAELKIITTDVTNGTEDTDMDFSVMNGGTIATYLRLDGSTGRIFLPSGADIAMNGGGVIDAGSFALQSRPSITGSRSGNAALASLLASHDGELWDDNTTA